MIARLSGLLDDFGPDWAVIDVNGVGYLVHCSARTLDALGVRGDRVTVHTELQVSENDMRLIGFASGGEREWFRLLTGMLEVGGGIALLVPRTAAFAAVLLALVMVGAVIAHLTVLGGSPALAVMLLVACAGIAWLRRAGLMPA